MFEHVLSLRPILDNLPISINESINPVTTNLLKIYRNVCTQVNMTFCEMMKLRHAELQQLKTKYYTQNTTTLRNNQERLLVDVVDLVI